MSLVLRLLYCQVVGPPQKLGIALAVAQLGVIENDVESMGWSAELISGTLAEGLPALRAFADLLEGVLLMRSRYTLRLRVRADALPRLRKFSTMEVRRDGTTREHFWRWTTPNRQPRPSRATTPMAMRLDQFSGEVRTRPLTSCY